MSELETRFGTRVVAFVLMGNHYHLIMQSTEARLADTMHFLGGTYARRFNRAHDRSGALFKGRYTSRLIKDDDQLHRAGVYVHLNPFAAGIVDQPVDYRWSSLRAYARGHSPIGWLRMDLLRGRSGPEYLALVDGRSHELDPKLVGATEDGHEWWQLATGDSVPCEAERAACERDTAIADRFGVSVDEIYAIRPGRYNIARTVAIAAARSAGIDPCDVADRYGLTGPASVRNSVRLLRARVAADPAVAAVLTELAIDL